MTQQELEDDLLEEVIELSPLNALDPEKLEKLTAKQRKFLIAFIGNGSITMSRKLTDVGATTWAQWKESERFQEIFAIVKSPPAFASAVGAALIWRAMMEHYKMFDSEKEATRQWAIERAYALRPKESPDSARDPGQLTNAQAKMLAEAVADQLPAELQAVAARRQPFMIVEGTAREVPNEPEEVEVVTT